MSEYYFCFIPDNPYYKLSTEQTDAVRRLEWYRGDMRIEVSDNIRFADAGGNLESVSCPFCKSDLMGWWSEAMDAAYDSDAKNFVILNITTPCCNKPATLQDLDYVLPQGFYKSTIEIPSDSQYSINEGMACEQLAQITKTSWRVIHAR